MKNIPSLLQICAFEVLRNSKFPLQMAVFRLKNGKISVQQAEKALEIIVRRFPVIKRVQIHGDFYALKDQMSVKECIFQSHSTATIASSGKALKKSTPKPSTASAAIRNVTASANNKRFKSPLIAAKSSNTTPAIATNSNPSTTTVIMQLKKQITHQRNLQSDLKIFIKHSKSTNLSEQIEKWRKVSLEALETLRLLIGVVDVGGETGVGRMLNVSELAKDLRIDLARLGYVPPADEEPLPTARPQRLFF